MAWTKKELTDWLKGLGLPEARLNTALEALGDESAAKIGEGVMAQADYTRQTQGLKDKEKQLLADIEKKNREADSFRGSLVDWKSGKEKEFNDAVAAKTALEAQLATVRTSIKTIAGTYGIPDADLAPIMTNTPGAPPVVSPARTEPERDAGGKFLTKEEAQNLPKITLVMNGLAREHARLFPNVPFDDVAIYDNALKNNRSLEAEWKETFKVDERRAELAKATHDTEIADAEKRGAESARSALLAENPTLAVRVRQGDQSHGSPILDRARAQAAAAAETARKEGKAPVEVSEGRGVDAAVRAFNAGTYQGGVEHKSA
jgi:hypothetical protein